MEAKERPFEVIGQLATLRRYARSLVRNSEDAEDLVHDALIKAYERKSTFRRDGNMRTWLMSILHNVHIDRLRRIRSQARRDDAAVMEAEHTVPAAQDHVVRLQQLRDAFFHLPEEQRAALHLVAIEDMPYAQAAETLGIPIGTLMSRISRARAQLRDFEDKTPAATHLRVIGGNDHENG